MQKLLFDLIFYLKDITEQELEDALKLGRLIEQAPEYKPQIEVDDQSSSVVEDELLDLSQINIVGCSTDENSFVKPNQNEDLNENEQLIEKKEVFVFEEKLESSLEEFEQQQEENELMDSNQPTSDELNQDDEKSVTQELPSARNSNVFTALLYLIKDLDQNELDLVIAECQKRKNSLDLLEE